MKKTVILLICLAAFLSGASAAEISEGMGAFLNGCIAMRDAIENQDFPKLTDAKMKLSQVEVSEYLEGENFFPADDESKKAVTLPKVIFTPEFAVKLSKEGVIKLEDVADAHLMRGLNEIKVWHASLQPGRSATFTADAFDECEMLLFAMNGSGMKLKVTDNNDAEAPTEQVAPDAWLARWTMPDDAAEFKFTITNDSDAPQTFVIAIN